jgi:hypothetical protein
MVLARRKRKCIFIVKRPKRVKQEGIKKMTFLAKVGIRHNLHSTTYIKKDKKG